MSRRITSLSRIFTKIVNLKGKWKNLFLGQSFRLVLRPLGGSGFQKRNTMPSSDKHKKNKKD